MVNCIIRNLPPEKWMLVYNTTSDVQREEKEECRIKLLKGSCFIYLVAALGPCVMFLLSLLFSLLNCSVAFFVVLFVLIDCFDVLSSCSFAQRK